MRRMEVALLLAHVICYLTTVLLVLSPLKAVVFIAVHQGLWGVYMGCAFAPNHKGMPILSAADKPDFLRKQVLTSRNIRGSRFVDFLLGGLNYQIEHHPFPQHAAAESAVCPAAGAPVLHQPRSFVQPVQPVPLLRAGAAAPACRWRAPTTPGGQSRHPVKPHCAGPTIRSSAGGTAATAVYLVVRSWPPSVSQRASGDVSACCGMSAAAAEADSGASVSRSLGEATLSGSDALASISFP